MKDVKEGSTVRVKSGYNEGQDGTVEEVKEGYFIVKLDLHGDCVEFFESDLDEGVIEVIGGIDNV